MPRAVGWSSVGGCAVKGLSSTLGGAADAGEDVDVGCVLVRLAIEGHSVRRVAERGLPCSVSLGSAFWPMRQRDEAKLAVAFLVVYEKGVHYTPRRP